MAEVKGKFITLGCHLMSAYPAAQAGANDYLKKETGTEWNGLEQEGWYNTRIFNTVMELYAKSSIAGESAIVTLGRKVYPTIKKTVGIPEHIKTPLDFIHYEAEGFLQNHRGDDVVPRKIIKDVDREVIVHAPAPGYNVRLYEGVFIGILEMCGIKSGKVENIGNSTFAITW
ncbi:MAG: hypothetical protein HZC28_03840 [Spirochaetes bacterium]|nr:hypothetical protein [Spirochaetota bacterium]